jgi:hypothetical protein
MRQKLLCALLMLASACSIGGTAGDPAREGERFHRLLDDADYSALYRSSSDLMVAGVPEDVFAELFGLVHDQKGAVRQATLRSARRYARPDGNFMVLHYDTRFERGTAQESIVYRIDARERLRLEGYQAEAPGWPGMMIGEFATRFESDAAKGEAESR